MPNPNMIPSTMAPATSKVSIPFEEESALSFVKDNMPCKKFLLRARAERYRKADKLSQA